MADFTFSPSTSLSLRGTTASAHLRTTMQRLLPRWTMNQAPRSSIDLRRHAQIEAATMMTMRASPGRSCSTQTTHLLTTLSFESSGAGHSTLCSYHVRFIQYSLVNKVSIHAVIAIADALHPPQKGGLNFRGFIKVPVICAAPAPAPTVRMAVCGCGCGCPMLFGDAHES